MLNGNDCRRNYCKKSVSDKKRRPAKYKSLDNAGEDKNGKLYKYRVIVPDPKDPQKDLFFVPATAVANQEQAKEEGALLALLQLTPSLPHERKLPEPYKTTWLNSVAAAKEASNKRNAKGNAGTSEAQRQATTVPPSNNSKAAQASSSLTMSHSYSSMAEKRQRQEKKRQKANARIRRHENIRMANQNHQVFMSQWMRQQIERLLRGEHVHWEDNDEEEEDDEDDGDKNDTQLYVEERLHSEGFTRRQARRAFEQINDSSRSCDENDWDSVYEECLQWLLVHLNEDQLPEGFDPRGRTLDVIGPGGNANVSSKQNDGEAITANKK